MVCNGVRGNTYCTEGVIGRNKGSERGSLRGHLQGTYGSPLLEGSEPKTGPANPLSEIARRGLLEMVQKWDFGPDHLRTNPAIEYDPF